MEIRDFVGRKEALQGHLSSAECRFDFEDELVDVTDPSRPIYFLPVADLDGSRLDQMVPSFWGIYIQEMPHNQSIVDGPGDLTDAARTFQRVGLGMDLEGGRDGHILDAVSWDFLCMHYKSGLQIHGTKIRLV